MGGTLIGRGARGQGREVSLGGGGGGAKVVRGVGSGGWMRWSGRRRGWRSAAWGNGKKGDLCHVVLFTAETGWVCMVVYTNGV